MEPVKILIIHDDMLDRDPLVVMLREVYGNENVLLRKKSSEGIKYIHDNLDNKLIVLLDFDLGEGEPHAPEVLEKIREETSLIYVIIITAKQFSSIPAEAMVNFINNRALGIIQNTADTTDIMNLVGKAAHELDSRIDCILEQWILRRPDDERNKPYLSTRSGKTYSLEQLILEIRQQTDLGKQLEKSILQLAIELLTNGNKKVDD